MATPEAFYRNAIDLNRYSNSVARRVINAYNDIIITAVNQLREIDELSAPVKAARLRAILAQLKESLNTWAGNSTELTASELQGLALLQTEFVENQLKQVVPLEQKNSVKTVEISPQFAQAVVTTDPTQLNVVTLSDDLYAAVQGAAQTYSLTATQGTMITLPNGQIVEKAFRGISEAQAERFNQVVRTGLLIGETTQQIAKQLIGRLQFGDFGPLSVRQIAAAGGELTAVANNQVLTLIRTSVNQVANEASMQVYEANQDITKKYKYVATLDTKTSAICRALDGKEFEYGKGPMPPQHFNCRSTVVAIIDSDILPPSTTAKRASKDGPVPINMTYGEWLTYKGAGETDADVRKKQAEALGTKKAAYFRKLVKKYGAKNAISKFVRDDGSELTLAQLRARYGSAQS
jgi:SPP1 gp7 family putative phage head morphogenesis protein